MSDPTELEQNAAQLRSLARQARGKAESLSTHLDRVVTSAQDDELWRGQYPSHATGQLEDYQRGLTNAADLLNDDATAWERRASQLESDAEESREEQRDEEQDSDDEDGPR